MALFRIVACFIWHHKFTKCATFVSSFNLLDDFVCVVINDGHFTTSPIGHINISWLWIYVNAFWNLSYFNLGNDFFCGKINLGFFKVGLFEEKFYKKLGEFARILDVALRAFFKEISRNKILKERNKLNNEVKDAIK